jgi:acyl-coenzyme A synthetase/AMP-(fatty) acid ligase
MVEQLGMLNHMFGKISTMQIGAADSLAQTASPAFDICVWQFLSALLVGGRTLLVEQEVIIDVERFVDTVVDGEVAVLQLVPSYLEVVLSYLEQHPRELPSLRCVSVTGEAVKRELAHRWFATTPGVKLVNAYGLTETSDDTNHEVMDRSPDGDSVPLGRPVNNVYVYVLDENLDLVPFGEPGEIAFSGVCVGRGYINDPERTAAAYSEDPHRPGLRLYRAGDFGRWRPDGKLEYLGRRDSQVKIRGFRIEIGEIENSLLGVPGVGDAAVVVAERAAGNRQLVAFYSGPEELPVDQLENKLGAALPVYMIPSAFHWHEKLPLTANGKIDKKALTALAGDLAGADRDHGVTSTPAERRLAAAWAQVLGIPGDRIDRSDHFFDLGGTSLSAVKLAVLLDRAVSLADIKQQPVLADMAALLSR